MKRRVRNETAALLSVLDEAYRKQAWHGPNLRGALRGVTAKDALWRPRRGRHSIYELVAHVTYWKYAVYRRLSGEKRGSFPMEGSNMFKAPARLTEAEWRKLLGLLHSYHALVMRVAAGIPASALHKRAAGSRRTPAYIIRGAAFHDIYHAAQIQLLKRLHGG